MLMERKLTIRETLCVRWLFSLITMLLVSVGMQAEDYDLWVAGVQVTSDNANNVLNDNNNEHYIVFNASTNTLTLNGYDEESDYEFVGNYEGAFIKNGLTNLIINLVGLNRIYCNLFLAKNVSGGNDYTATLTTATNSPGRLILRVDDESVFYSGHKIIWENGLARINNGYDNDKHCYEIEITTDYRLSVGGNIICTTNGDVVEGVFDNKVTYSATNNTLTLNGATIAGNISVKSLAELIVKVKGQNVINAGPLSAIKSYASDNVQLTFSKDGDGDCSLQLNSDDITVISTGFSEPVYDNLALVLEDESITPEYYNYYDIGLAYYQSPNTIPITSATITSYTTYGIIVSGEAVTSANQNSICKGTVGAGHITFDGEHTLTLNRVPNVVFNGEYPFIQTSMDLTIKLVGKNEFDCGQSTFITRMDGDNNTHTVTFTPDATYSGMLALTCGDQFDGFEKVFTNNLAWKPAGYYDGLEPGNGNPVAWVGQPSLGLKIDGTVVTAGNSANVLGDVHKSVSYNSSSKTLTLKGAKFFSLSADENTELKVYLVGYNEVGNYYNNEYAFDYAGDAASLTFETSEVLPGTLTCYSPNVARTGNVTYNSGLKLEDGEISVTKENLKPVYFAGYVSNEGNDDFLYAKGGDFHFTKVGFQESTPIVSTKEEETTAAMWRSYLADADMLLKAYFQLDWGECNNKAVTIQLKGMTNGEEDGQIYSSPISLSDADENGILEISLNKAMTSENIKFVLSSDEAFSFVPLSVGYLYAKSYDIMVAHTNVSEQNKNDVLGDGTVSYDAEHNTLTLNNATINWSEQAESTGIDYSGTADLTIKLIGTNKIKGTGGCEAIRYNGEEQETLPKLDIVNGTSLPCSLQLETAGEESVIAGFGEVRGVNGIGSATGSLTISPSETVYNPDPGLYTISEQEQIQLQVPVSSATISAENVLTVAGVGVTASGNVFTEGANAGKVTFDADNNKLTLNGAVLDGGIEWNSSANLTIELNGENSITCSNETNAFKAVIEGAYPTLAFVKVENATSASLMLTVPNSMNTISGFNYPISHEGMFMIDDENETVCTTLVTSAILSGGSGTSADPFIIETAADLKNFSEYIEESIISNTSCAKLSDDISQNGLDCSSVTIEPIGYGNIFFAGTFDGNGKTIKNLTIADDAGSCVGFFRILGANGTIKDLTIDNLTLSGGNSSTNNIGGLVGYLNGGTISNCTIKNSTISCKNDSQSPTVGGLVGELSSGSITNCTVQACTVNAVTEDTGNSGPVAQAGGVVGNASGGTISGCQVKGATVVLADYGEYEASVVAGAIVGRIGSATLSSNIYEYAVTASTMNANRVSTTKSGYTHRGTNAQTDPTGISLYTKPVVLPAGTAQATVIGEQDTYYATVEIGEGLGILVAPGQTATLNAIPENGYAIASLTATNNTTSETITTTATAMGGNEVQYTFTMPDDSVTVTMTTAQAYGITVAGVVVTELNAGNVLGDGTVIYDAEHNMLTLNGATIGNDGSDPEPMEVCGIDYSETADLTISLKGTNTIYGMGGCEAIRYNGGEQTHPKLIFTKGDNQKCSLQLKTSSDYERTAISGGFSEIQGVWGVGATDNGLAIIAANEVKYDSEEGLTIEKVVNYTVNYIPLSSTLIASYYGLTISGVPVYEGNKESITGEGIYGNGTASFDPTTNTLTLNNVNLNPDYAQNDGDLRVSIVTSLAQLNINLVGESQTYAIKATNEDCQLTFQSAEANRGAAKLNFWYNAEPYYIGFGENKVIYDDGLCLRESWSNSSFPKIVALDVPKVVTEEKERGLYYPDHEFTFSMQEEIEGFDIYYANMLGGDPVKTTNGKFTLTEDRYVIRAYPIYPGMDTDPGRNSQFASEIYAKVIAKPTFSKETGTYNEGFTLTLQNVPEQDAREEWADSEPENIMVPQVWYYLDDNKNDSIRYDATKGISVTESCKVSVYVIDVDSAKKLKSTPVEAQYVIRQNAGLAYANEVAEYVIGGKDNEDLPELENENNVAVTYTSDDEQVATVDATGKVTIVGLGETTITASSAQTETLLEGEASYLLRVYKDLNYESITVSVATATYTGEAVEPEVTVMDGETDITDLMIISYDNNIQVGDEASVTIVPNDDLEVNFYVGSRTKTFSIINRTLEIGKDVNFASGQKWASFYTTTENLELPDGVMAYIVTGVANSAVSVKAINYVPKNVPVLIEKESTATTDNASAEGNLLQGTTESTAISGIEGNVYVLYNGGFTRATSGAIPAYRAYLVLEQNAGARLSIFEDDATGIGAVANSQQQKANDQYYDMQGRKVESHAKKGLYIKNGRKVVVK